MRGLANRQELDGIQARVDRGRWERNLATYHQFGMVERLAAVDEVIDGRFLVEKGGLSQGTTAYSSRLIHGGLRYLAEGDIGLVKDKIGRSDSSH